MFARDRLFVVRCGCSTLIDDVVEELLERTVVVPAVMSDGLEVQLYIEVEDCSSGRARMDCTRELLRRHRAQGYGRDQRKTCYYRRRRLDRQSWREYRMVGEQ